MRTADDIVSWRSGRRRPLRAAGSVAAAALALALTGCSSGSAGSSGSPTTTALGGARPEVIAVLRAGTPGVAASSLASGSVEEMAGVAGSAWDSTAPRRVLFYLESNAQVGEIEQIVHALRGRRIVQAVEVSVPG